MELGQQDFFKFSSRFQGAAGLGNQCSRYEHLKVIKCVCRNADDLRYLAWWLPCRGVWMHARRVVVIVIRNSQSCVAIWEDRLLRGAGKSDSERYRGHRGCEDQRGRLQWRQGEVKGVPRAVMGSERQGSMNHIQLLQVCFNLTSQECLGREYVTWDWWLYQAFRLFLLLSWRGLWSLQVLADEKHSPSHLHPLGFLWDPGRWQVSSMPARISKACRSPAWSILLKQVFFLSP